MEIRLPKVIKFCARKTIKNTHFMSPCKIIFFLGCDDEAFPIKCELWAEMSPRIIKTVFEDPQG